MKREPVYEDGALIGHKCTVPASYARFRDARGYESVVLMRPEREVFEPIEHQRGMFDEEE
ncbi:hypothetical protein [Burkholderia cenocepacia]|uniref:hypothetical protein n=1 Tax=Burkholderia cenocepacia TaxID=95486 RepID=UPI0013DEA5AE|nr:hypothetical protein [Burkholderia cenocepacia]MCW3587370.1 hypothetical protein [Burkholderia cenocepacia]MCW3632574.1 hypothetical protein [Burkholderia cenocepacia]MCW5181805.1 hypothetical protein [Burkholderia cenocepacia]